VRMHINRAVNVQFSHLGQFGQRRRNRPTQVVYTENPVVGRRGRVWWVERGRVEAEREGGWKRRERERGWVSVWC
jgi:hypothetical protein